MTRPNLPNFSRFAWLMGLYGENFQRVSRLFDFDALAPGRYVSQVPGGLETLGLLPPPGDPLPPPPDDPPHGTS